jgi:hypothetical protein
MYNTQPISSKSLRLERWQRDAKEITLYALTALALLSAIVTLGAIVVYYAAR